MNTRQITECKFAMLPLSHTPWTFDYRYGMGKGPCLCPARRGIPMEGVEHLGLEPST